MKSPSTVRKLALLLAFSCCAFAHVISVGYENAGPGSVSFWYGSYHTQAEATYTEGSMTLVGINGNSYPSATVSFNLPAYVKPAGLIDGTTNFYADTSNPNGLTATPFSMAAVSWEGVTFSGLAPGDYRFTYNPIAYPTMVWEPYTNGVLSNTVTLSNGVVGAVPEPSPAILVAAGVGAIALALRRRDGRRAEAA